MPQRLGLTGERSSLAGETGPWVDAPVVVVVLLAAPVGGLEKSRRSCNESGQAAVERRSASGGLTVRCFRDNRRPDGWCPADVARLVSIAMPVSAAICGPGRLSGRRPHAGHQRGHGWSLRLPTRAGAAGPDQGPLLPQATAVLVPACGPDTVASMRADGRGVPQGRGRRVGPCCPPQPARGVHKLGSPAHPGALGDRPPDALTPLAGVLLDLCWILLPAVVVRFRHASVVVVRALVMSGTTMMDKPLPALRALMGLFRYAARQQVWISDQNATTRQGIGVGLWAGDGRDFPPTSLHRTWGCARRDGTGGDDP
jgi:hypothetical protein